MTRGLVLVLGGAGFIGSHVNKLLNQSGYETLILDNLSSGSKETVLYGKFIEGDLSNTDLLEQVFSEYPIRAVMHFAAFIDVGESVIDPLKYYTNNVVNTLEVLRMMIRHNVLHFIFSSSAAIFGLPETERIAEDHPQLPINPYGRTKSMVEALLKDFDAAYGLKSSCLRYFNAAGGDPEREIKNFKKRESNLIPVVLRSLTRGDRRVSIFGTDYPTADGTCIRDYIHVWDLARAHLLAMEQLFSSGYSSYYNLGNGSGYSVKQVIEAAEKVSGIHPSLVFAPRRSGDPHILLADSRKAERELGWRPAYPDLETIVADALAAGIPNTICKEYT